MARKPKPSQWVLLGSLVLGAAAAAGAAWTWPGAHWALYAGGGFVLGALTYSRLLELFAYEALVDRD